MITGQYPLLTSVTHENKRELGDVKEPKKLVPNTLSLTNNGTDPIHFRLGQGLWFV